MPRSTRLDPKTAVAAVFVASLFMSIMDTTIVNVALPSIGDQFHVGAASVGIVNVGYLVSLAVFVPLSGWLGDRYGTRRVFLSALAVFTLASLLCGTAQTLDQLSLYRVAQGAGGGMLTPVGMTMLFRAFPQEERMRASRVLMIPTAVAPALGPVLGGWLVDSLSWHWVFIVNVPIGAAAMAFGLLNLPDFRTERAGRFDPAGFLLAAVGFGGVMYALAEGAGKGWGTPGIVGPAVVGAVALVALVVVELRLAEPMLDLRLFKDRLFRTVNLLSLASGAAFLGMLYVFPLYYQDAVGASALRTGLNTFPEAIGVMIASQLAGRLYPRVGPRRLIAVGAVGVAVMLALMSRLTPETTAWAARALMFGTGFCMAYIFLPAQTAAFATISGRATGRASTLFNAQRQLGPAAGVALLGAVLTSSGMVTAGHGGTPVANLAAYHAAFLTAAGLALLAAVIALFVSDRDAAPTMTPKAGTSKAGTSNAVTSNAGTSKAATPNAAEPRAAAEEPDVPPTGAAATDAAPADTPVERSRGASLS
ncbi:MDR family MFS transporter [Streptacidiphilus sp. P02-A3a]|uniref:MDR family MFS transporter n=1 Tax=Streptacidiphilus sp. P02-A3a TaxID=2704468 RepID=UPI0015FE07D7|nr:MDR family MFS transporter [Streptacidiphilus sp. P02-A3a]QMU68125.1 multidrug efflux MFS transporter [Streptacidiphilus sp. P02-A3a]